MPLRSAQDRMPGAPPDTEAGPTWHQLLRRKAAEWIPDTGDWGALMGAVGFPEPHAWEVIWGRGEGAVCGTSGLERPSQTPPHTHRELSTPPSESTSSLQLVQDSGPGAGQG